MDFPNPRAVREACPRWLANALLPHVPNPRIILSLISGDDCSRVAFSTFQLDPERIGCSCDSSVQRDHSALPKGHRPSTTIPPRQTLPNCSFEPATLGKMVKGEQAICEQCLSGQCPGIVSVDRMPVAQRACSGRHSPSSTSPVSHTRPAGSPRVLKGTPLVEQRRETPRNSRGTARSHSPSLSSHQGRRRLFAASIENTVMEEPQTGGRGEKTSIPNKVPRQPMETSREETCHFCNVGARATVSEGRRQPLRSKPRGSRDGSPSLVSSP